MKPELLNPAREPLPVVTVPKSEWPRHPGWARRMIARAASLPISAVNRLELLGNTIQRVANTLRFERFWSEKITADPRVIIVPTFNKTLGKHPIWNVAINWLTANACSGQIIEFGTNNGGWLKYFVDRLPETIAFTGFDCFEGLPEAWDGLPAGSIKGFGAPTELWADDPVARAKVMADAERGIHFPEPPQSNVSIMTGLFSETVPLFLKDGWPKDIRLIHFDADLYISTRPVLDTLCGPLDYRYLVLFDEFYSANHEFRAWQEFTALYKLDDWRVVAASEDGSQVLIEVNTRRALAA